MIPCEVVTYELVDSGWEQIRLYIITARFLAVEAYDVRIYLPVERERDLVYGRCWEHAEEVVENDRDRLLALGKEVIWDARIAFFQGLPRPPVLRQVVQGGSNEAVVGLAL